MLTPDEEKFLKYWQENRFKEKNISRQLRVGLPFGLLLGVGILLNYMTGWYTRANMIANAQFSPITLVIAIMIITVFTSVFYRKHRWEMNEQRFTELTLKKERMVSDSSDAAQML